jgi:Ca2+-binding RTX toxin-like protein
MKNRVRPNGTRAARPIRMAAIAVAMAAVVAGGGIAAAPADAASSHTTGKASYRHRQARFVHVRLEHGTLRIRGTRASDKIALRLKAGRPDILQVDVGDDGYPDFSFRRRYIAKIAVDARAGDDVVRIDEANGVFTDSIATTVDGGAGNDTLAGGAGAEKLLGGDGNDTIDGNGGNDLALMGTGDDTFVWDPGDGSDTVEGQAGSDTMRFNGAAAAEHIDLSANGNRLRFFRDVANITMDTNDVEIVDFNALGGADTITVNDLTGTDVHNVSADLAGTPGGSTGDGQTDSVIVNGTNGNDAITAAGSNGAVSVTGLAATVSISNAEPANDTLAVNGLDGNDIVDGSALQASAIKFAIDGGAGDDVLTGGAGNDSLFGRDGNDKLIGGPGLDLLDGGTGNNILIQD